MGVVFGQIVGDTRESRVDVGAAEILGRHLFARRRLHERRTAQEDGARALDDDRFVRHRGHVGAASRARAHDDRNLRDALGGHARLVVKDAAEVIAVGEHLCLQRQEGTARVHEVDARKPVLERNLLRTEMLLDGQGIVGAALDRGIVGNDEDVAVRDASDARHEAGGRRVVVVHVPRGKRRELEERRIGIEQLIDAFAHGKLALRAVPLQIPGAAALARGLPAFAQLAHEPLHPLAVRAECV